MRPSHALRLFGAFVVCGCGDAPATASVSTGAPDAQEAADDDAGPAAQPDLRGETPLWPGAADEVVVAYRAGDVSYPLAVDAQLSQLDLHVNVDTTASIAEEIDALQHELRSSVITAIAERVPSASIGVSRFADFPLPPFGEASDHAFVLLTPITSDLERVTAAVSRLDNPLDRGSDELEAGGEALYQVATGEGYKQGPTTYIKAWNHAAAVGGGTLGGVGFREHALKVVMHVTDIYSHTPAEYATGHLMNTHGIDAASAALQKLDARVIGIMSTKCVTDDCSGDAKYAHLRQELSQLAVATHSTITPHAGMCPTGIGGTLLPTYQDTCPLVFDVRPDGSGLTTTVKDAVVGLLDDLQLGEVHGEVVEDPLGFVHAFAVEPVEQQPGVEAPKTADRLPLDASDGIDDTYLAVGKRVRLGFRVTLRNDRLAPGDVAQRFRILLRVIGDGIIVAERTLRIVVPAGERTRPERDATVPVPTADAGNADDAGR